MDLLEKGDHNPNNRSYIIWITMTWRMITRNKKHIKATPITAWKYLQDQLDKHTKTDPLEDILKHCESHAKHCKTNAYNEQLDNSSNRTSYTTGSQKAHHTIRGVHRVKETQKTILITGQLIEKERIIMKIAQDPLYGRLIKKPDRLDSVRMIHPVQPAHQQLAEYTNYFSKRTAVTGCF